MIIGGLILDYVLVFPRGVAPAAVDAALVIRLGIVAGIVLPLFHLLTRRAEAAR